MLEMQGPLRPIKHATSNFHMCQSCSVHCRFVMSGDCEAVFLKMLIPCGPECSPTSEIGHPTGAMAFHMRVNMRSTCVYSVRRHPAVQQAVLPCEQATVHVQGTFAKSFRWKGVHLCGSARKVLQLVVAAPRIPGLPLATSSARFS